MNDMENLRESAREMFADCFGTCNWVSEIPINTQEEFSKQYFPKLPRTPEGYAINKNRLFFKRKFGPVTHDNYMMNLCHPAFVDWQGRTQEINQYEYQLREVDAGRMRPLK